MAKLTAAERFLIENYDTFYEMWETEDQVWGKTLDWLNESIETLKSRSWFQERPDLKFKINDEKSLTLQSAKWSFNRQKEAGQICAEPFDPDHLYRKGFIPYIGIWVGEQVTARHPRSTIARGLGLALSSSVQAVPGTEQAYREEWVMMEPLASPAILRKAFLDHERFQNVIVSRFDELSRFIPKLDRYFGNKRNNHR